MMVGCVPWDKLHFVKPDGNLTKICTIFNSQAFERQFKSDFTCPCPKDCEEVFYSYSVVAEKLEVDEICNENGGRQENTLKSFDDHHTSILLRNLVQKIGP